VCWDEVEKECEDMAPEKQENWMEFVTLGCGDGVTGNGAKAIGYDGEDQRRDGAFWDRKPSSQAEQPRD
jgi:hypothetical protein